MPDDFFKTFCSDTHEGISIKKIIVLIIINEVITLLTD